MERHVPLWAIIAAAVTALGLGAFLLMQLQCDGPGPGGMRPSYPARDYDLRLTREAATARPLIDAIAAYQRRSGALPKDLSQLPGKPSPDPWRYTLDPDGRHYTLWRALGWDPSLRWEGDGSTGRWVFDPGDGSPEKDIRLNP